MRRGPCWPKRRSPTPIRTAGAARRPVIFRATPQWFISMEKTGLRKAALTAIDQVEWIPHWGRERIYGMIENRPDWCVSRQRAWGVPITVFYCAKCGATHMTPELMQAIHDLFVPNTERTHGSARRRTSCCRQAPPVQPMRWRRALRRETDILDVWFDSGTSHAAVLEARENLRWPADLYLEGTDQHRGWFHSSLLIAIGTRQAAPYKAVLTHGFVVDAEGKKAIQISGQCGRPERGDQPIRCRDPANVGFGVGLQGRHPDFRQDPQTADRCLPPHPQHQPVLCWVI